MQLLRYEEALCGRDAVWFRTRIEDSYDRFGFPPLSQLVAALGVKSYEQDRWWSTVTRNLRTGAYCPKTESSAAAVDFGGAPVPVLGHDVVRLAST